MRILIYTLLISLTTNIYCMNVGENTDLLDKSLKELDSLCLSINTKTLFSASNKKKILFFNSANFILSDSVIEILKNELNADISNDGQIRFEKIDEQTLNLLILALEKFKVIVDQYGNDPIKLPDKILAEFNNLKDKDSIEELCYALVLCIEAFQKDIYDNAKISRQEIVNHLAREIDKNSSCCRRFINKFFLTATLCLAMGIFFIYEGIVSEHSKYKSYIGTGVFLFFGAILVIFGIKRCKIGFRNPYKILVDKYEEVASKPFNLESLNTTEYKSRFSLLTGPRKY